jgi:hypothetical protein
MKPARFHDEATAEVMDATDYYESRRAGLGARYRAAVEDAVAAIQGCPTVYSLVAGSDARKCLVQGFSYNVYFVEFDTFIWIAAVAHQKRRQDYWMSRTPEDG